MEFYSATKNKILSLAGQWMEMESIILSEVSQARKPMATSCFLSYVEYRPNTNISNIINA
jgi:hypothetical protein